ncbi:hypothetical protein ACWEN4_23345 [Streptomyces violaceorubidus]
MQWLAYPVAVVTSLASLGHDDFWLRPEFARQVASESVVRKIERWQRREIRVARAAAVLPLIAVGAGVSATLAAWPVADWRRALLLLAWPCVAMVLCGVPGLVRDEDTNADGAIVLSLVVAALLACLYFILPAYVDIDGPEPAGRESAASSVQPSQRVVTDGIVGGPRSAPTGAARR